MVFFPTKRSKLSNNNQHRPRLVTDQMNLNAVSAWSNIKQDLANAFLYVGPAYGYTITCSLCILLSPLTFSRGSAKLVCIYFLFE